MDTYMGLIEDPLSYDVCISFNDKDTGKGFTSHLNASLKRRGLKTLLFIEPSAKSSPIFLQASCPPSKIFVIVFSENLVCSNWYWDQLLLMLKIARDNNRVVVPVFYDVNPSTVRKQTGSYAEAFAKFEQAFNVDRKTIQSWRKALTEAASFSGWDCTVNVRTEHEIVEEIAEDVVKKLDRAYVGDLDFQIAKLEKLAQLQQEISQEMHNSENERNYKATLERITRLKMEKKFRLLRLTPDLLSHLEISKTTDTYF